MNLDIVQWHSPKPDSPARSKTPPAAAKPPSQHMPAAVPVDYLQQVQEDRKRLRTECDALLWRCADVNCISLLFLAVAMVAMQKLALQRLRD